MHLLGVLPYAPINAYFNPSAVECLNCAHFLAEDPLSFAAGDANLYRYVQNKPVSYIDPLGKYIVVRFGEHLEWLNWLWALGIHASGYPIIEYGQPTLVYIYVPFGERQRLRDILNRLVAEGRLNREWAENLLQALAATRHVRGYGDLSISWTSLDEDIILQILGANEQAAGRGFNTHPFDGWTMTIGVQAMVHAVIPLIGVSCDFNVGRSKRYGWTYRFTVTESLTTVLQGRGLGLGANVGPHFMWTNAASVEELLGFSEEEGIWFSYRPWWSGWSVFEVHGSSYGGIDVGTPPGMGMGAGYACTKYRTW